MTLSLGTLQYTDNKYVIKPTGNTTNSTYYFRNTLLDDSGIIAELTPTGVITLNNHILETDSFGYNNPVNNILTIDSKEEIKNAIIFNTSGQKTLESNLNTIDTSSLNTGVYFVTIVTENEKTATFKIIKK